VHMLAPLLDMKPYFKIAETRRDRSKTKTLNHDIVLVRFFFFTWQALPGRA